MIRMFLRDERIYATWNQAESRRKASNNEFVIFQNSLLKEYRYSEVKVDNK